MARVRYVIVENEGYTYTADDLMEDLVKNKIVSYVMDDDGVMILGRYGTNKSVLKKILKKEMED